MNILITGATGFVGKKLVQKIIEQDSTNKVFITTRNVSKAKNIFKNDNIIPINWDYSKQLKFDEMQSLDAVINLMGENISNKRWSDSQKQLIYSSRITATKNLVTSINNQCPNLKSFVSTSAIGIYKSNTDAVLDEQSAPGEGFLAKTCIDWENEVSKLNSNIRSVIIRVGVVLDYSGGAIAKMIIPFKLGLGGILGDGKQDMSWIHRDDLVSLYQEALNNDSFRGIYNGVAPEVVNNYEFTKALGRAISRPTIFPVPKFIIKLIFGEMASILLDSQNVENKRLKDADFKYLRPTIKSALE